MQNDELRLDLNSCKPLREMVFETIRNGIVSGMLKPGQRLMEVQLAEQLGVSRTPVRESIRKLELEGLVKMVPRRGAYVTPLSAKDLREMMEIRGALEGLCGELVAKNATSEDVVRLKEANRKFDAAIAEGDEEGIIKHDIDFHEILYRASGNERLSDMLGSLREQMQRIRVEYVQNIPDRKHLAGQHQTIIEAVEEGDLGRAEGACVSHIAITMDDMLTVFDEDEKTATV